MTKSKDKKNKAIDFENPKYYINRELSWLAFNERVLSEAEDMDNPLFEKLKFLSISASNLDEFFMVRVASLKDMINADYKKLDIAGMTAKQQLEKVLLAVHEFVDKQYEIYNEQLVPALLAKGLMICRAQELSGKDAEYVDRYFDEFVYPPFIIVNLPFTSTYGFSDLILFSLKMAQLCASILIVVFNLCTGIKVHTAVVQELLHFLKGWPNIFAG